MALAPTQLGGSVTYVIVDGNSMEPGFHFGDLLLVRTESGYQVGDAVTYQNKELGRFVFHRIIGTELDRFILKGDNNSWLDSYHPNQNEVVGKLWVHVPKFGRTIEWMRLPINLAITMGLFGGVLMSGMITKTPKDNKRKNRKPSKIGGTFEGPVYLLGFLTLVFLAISIIFFTRPLTRTAENIPYQQEGNFFYSATGTPGVYDTDLVRSGEPVFPKLTCFLNLGFTYNLLGTQIQEVSGSHHLYARILDDQSGWQRTIPLNPETKFNGNSFFTTAVLDLCHVVSLVSLVEQETGLHPNTYTLEIVNHTAFTAAIAGKQASDTFDPSLVFRFDKAHFYLATNDTQANPLHSSKDGMLGSSDLQTNTFSIFGFQPTVWSMRLVSLLGLALSLTGLCIAGMNIYNTAQQSQESSIHFKYGSMLVDVFEQSLAPSLTVIDVATIDDLARLAERHGTMILHMAQNFLHYYLVQINGTTYRYVISSGRKGAADDMQIDDKVITHTISPLEKQVVEPLPVRVEPTNHKVVEDETERIDPTPLWNERSEPAAYASGNIITYLQPAREEITEYVIQTGEIVFTLNQPETEILRRIKL